MSHSDWQTKADERISWCKNCGWRFIAKTDEQHCQHCEEDLAEQALKSMMAAMFEMRKRKHDK